MTGEWRNTIDDKGRLTIPPKLRDEIGSETKLYLTRSANRSVWLMGESVFNDMKRLVNKGPMAAFDKKISILKKFIIDPAKEVELDKAGRIAIQDSFRNYAEIELKKECVILGSEDRIEICGAEAYDRLLLENMDSISEIASDLFPFRSDNAD